MKTDHRAGSVRDGLVERQRRERIRLGGSILPIEDPHMTRQLFLVASVLLVVLAGAALAEQAGPGKAAPATNKEQASEGPESKTILELIMEGGPLNITFMSVLGVFSLACVTVIIERLVNLTRRRIVPNGFVTALEELVRAEEDDPDRFRELCHRYPTPVAHILQAGLVRAGRPVPEVEKAMEDAAAREMARIRAGTRPLTVLGNVAPLVGLLGTVVGMILAFRTASQAGLGKAELLAQGIYLALGTTVAGLAIAIPCQLFAAWFGSRADRYLREIGEHLSTTALCFTRMEGGRRQTTARERLEAVESI